MDFNINILVVDDFPGTRQVLIKILTDIGFKNFFEADDGIGALEVFKSTAIGLALVDWQMPNLNGIDLVKVIRKSDKLKHIPVIIITSEGQKDKIIEAYKAGISSFIVKPFQADTLKMKIFDVFDR